MPTFIVKPMRDEDFYVFWSTVVDAPTAFGTRAEVIADCPPDRSVIERLDRADAHGTSMIDGRWFGWHDTEWMVRECAPARPGYHYTVRRDQVRGLCEALSAGIDPTPFLTLEVSE